MAHVNLDGQTRNLTTLDKIVGSFDQSWERSDPSLVEYWQGLGKEQSLSVLLALIKVDLQRRFERGEQPTAAEYFELFPQLTEQDDWALSLLYVEFCLLEESDRQPRVSEFCARYERWRDSLVSQLGYHRNFSQISGVERPRVEYPEVGERFETYQLSSILGKGGAAQVYLATDDLGGRQVVLKVSPSIGREPSILASLEHRNIVPILTVAKSPTSGLQGICMPYRPGRTLESILKSFSVTGLPKKAASIWDLLEVHKVEQETIDLGWKDFPSKGTYTEAIAWLGLAMTNALAYLHHRGIYHRDIKPANILLANREGPLLFDFNLAHIPHAAEHAQDAILGGTPPYMAPEQLGAFIDPSKWGSVGASADIYALGLVLRELVTGLKPDVPNSSLPLTRAIQDLCDRRHEMLASIRASRPEVPPSLEAIILHCLAFHPSDRYQSAGQLSEDLRLFLQRMPLKHAANSSKFEVFVNWTYRKWKVVAASGLAFLLAWLLAHGYNQPWPPASLEPAIAVNPLLPESPPLNLEPIDTGQASRFNASKSEILRTAVEHLDSRDPARLIEARRSLEQLRRDYPQSGWPLLYLALTLDKLGDRVEAHSLTKEVCLKVDAAEAIMQRLREDPSSIPMRTLLSYLYSSRKAYEKARQPLNEVIQLDPENEGAFALLADLARYQHRNIEAITLYQKTIEVASKKRQSALVNSSRGFLIPVMLAEVDRLLKDPKKASIPEVKDLLDRLNIQIPLLEAEWKQDSKTSPSRGLCNIAMCRGSLNSAWAYLYALNGQEREALASFQSAHDFFKTALKANAAEQDDPKKSARSREFATYIRSQQTELDRRLAASGLYLKPIIYQ